MRVLFQSAGLLALAAALAALTLAMAGPGETGRDGALKRGACCIYVIF